MAPENAIFLVLLLLGYLTCSLCRSGDTWTQMQVRCLSEAAAIYRAQASSDVHCSVIASNKQKVGIIVAQFELVSLRCSLFRYQSVCRDLFSSGASSDCRVLIRFPIKYPAQLNPKLTNVWLGDDMSAFENVVCQADEETNRIYPVGVQWTKEGAAFDGSSSFLAMNKSDIGFGTGVTVLLRMKRQPKVHAFFEFLDCSNFATGRFYSHIWEHNEALKPYALVKTQASSVAQRFMASNYPMTSNASEWVNLGFTSTPSADSWGMFLGSGFLPPSTVSVTSSTDFAFISPSCFRFGKRLNDDAHVFKGTVRAIAMATSFMTEAEIREFFALVST